MRCGVKLYSLVKAYLAWVLAYPTAVAAFELQQRVAHIQLRLLEPSADSLEVPDVTVSRTWQVDM